MGLQTGLSPEVLREYQSRSLVTCCNIHYEGEEINDANYYVGQTVPLGTTVQVQKVGGDSITFLADGRSSPWHTNTAPSRSRFSSTSTRCCRGRPEGWRRTFSTRSAGRHSRWAGRAWHDPRAGHLGAWRTRRPTARRLITAAEWLYWYNRWVTYKVALRRCGRRDADRRAPSADDGSTDSRAGGRRGRPQLSRKPAKRRR